MIVNRIGCDFFNRGEIVVYADSVALPLRNQGFNQSSSQGFSYRRKRVIVEYFIGQIEKLPGDTLRIGKASYIIPMECCKRCGCKDCRFYLLKTPAGEQLVHKHQMIGKAYKLF